MLGSPATALLILLLVAPAAVLVLYSFWTSGFFDVEHVFTLSAYKEVLGSELYRGLLFKSIGVGLACAILTVAVGYVVAYTAAVRMPRRGQIIIGIVVLSTMASYVVRIYSWQSVLGTNGFINSGLERLGLIAQPLTFLLYGTFSVVVVLTYVYLPIAVLPVYASLQDMDSRKLEAGRDLGASRTRVFWDVTVPQTVPALRTAFVLTFILTASDYVTPSLVGGLSGQMIGSAIQQQFVSTGDYPLGAAMAVIFIVCVVIALVAMGVLGWALLRLKNWWSTAYARLSSGRSGRRLLPSCSWGLPAFTLAVMLFLVTPLIVMTVFSFNNSPVPGMPWRGFTLDWYSTVLTSEDFQRALVSSLKVAVIAVVGAFVVGVPAAFLLSKPARPRRWAWFEPLLYGPVAVPGVVIGTGILLAAVTFLVPLGLGVTAAAHMMLICPFVAFIVRSRLQVLDPRLPEASRDLGASPLRTLLRITVPLLGSALAAAAVLAAAISLDQVVVTNFTIGANATIPTWVYGQARVGLTPAINAVAVLLLVVPAVVLGGAYATISRSRRAMTARRLNRKDVATTR